MKLITLDFDGVIHSYSSGWKGARNIPDPPVNGAIEWIEEFIMNYCSIPESICAMAIPRPYETASTCQLAVFSSRSRYFGGRRAMKKWLVKHGLDRRFLEVILFPLWKPSSFVSIDDRAITFDGTFPDPKTLLAFLPWNKKPNI